MEGKGEQLTSVDPSTGKTIWEGKAADAAQVQKATEAAANAFKSWSKLTLQARIEILQKARQRIDETKDIFADIISQDTGKTLWEAQGEVSAVLGKFNISIEAYNNRCAFKHIQQPSSSLIVRHKPHGVVAILGPYNFPVHLPNGHVVPALLAGNTAIFKPSELTPYAAEHYVDCWHQAGLPPGVLNLIQGAATVGKALVDRPEIRGLFFTGSWPTGRKLAEASLPYPKRILALEMGGNNPLIVWNVQDKKRSALLVILSAYITTGQRCSCARRLIIPQGTEGDLLLKELILQTEQLTIGPAKQQPQPFMGPLISSHSAQQLWKGYQALISKGAKPLIAMKEPNDAFVNPTLVDCTSLKSPEDCEYFGPFLQVYRASTFEKAMEIANQTEYGLCAGIVTDEAALYHTFWQESQAGIVNWNIPLTGASSQAPFGGLGKSGNYHPSAYYAADYCAYPVASMEAPEPTIPQTPPGLK